MSLKKRKTSKSNKWVTIYKPNNSLIVKMITDVHKALELKDEQGRPLSLGKFILLSCSRDINRMVAMSEEAAKQQGEEHADIDRDIPDNAEDVPTADGDIDQEEPKAT